MFFIKFFLYKDVKQILINIFKEFYYLAMPMFVDLLLPFSIHYHVLSKLPLNKRNE